ncbi:MAG: metallophosphoesterase [Candidatus Latescibacteria bacterium]|nr:metallophosphoesterase [Candidatus Latescibacterota bacterium]
MFGTVLTIAITIMHIYVFWRAGSVPFLKRLVSRKSIYLSGLALWSVFYLSREFGHGGIDNITGILELFGMNWMAVLFLTSVTLLIVDLITIFGLLLPGKAPSLRGIALAVGGLISIIAIIQGIRPPVIDNYEVYMSGLPDKMDGMVIIAMSDLHLGSIIGERWLAARVDQVEKQQPDMIFLLGDIIEGHGKSDDELLPVLRRLSAPMGIWAVLGNHEFHGRDDSGTLLFMAAGIQVLRNSWTEVMPGFILAGVDNLSGRLRSSQGGDPISKALNGRPPGATVFLSHKPLYADRVANAGVGLMLCGHTHGGQIWPFGYLVRRDYPLLAGKYEVNGMTVIVCRGTGTWGPRMRLWHPGEILRITLHVK